jgi:hypothetical protein
VECESKSDTGKNTGDWNYFKITQTVPQQHTRESTKLRNCKKEATAHVLQKALMLKYKTYLTGEMTLHVAQNVNTEQLQHYVS